MKATIENFMKHFPVLFTFVGVCLFFSQPYAESSPFATLTSGIPLNQSTNDSINGILGTSTNAPASGSLSSLTDADSAATPTASVIVGPDTTAPVAVSWDLGTLIDPALRRLDSVSIWIADDTDRTGFNGSFMTSTDGINYTAITDSLHVVGWNSTPGLFHNIFYDFTGTNVSNFRYLQLVSSGFLDINNNTTFQPRYVELDVNTTNVPEPSTLALLLGGASLAFVSLHRKKRPTC